METLKPYYEDIVSLTLTYAPKVLLAVFTLIIGFKIISFLLSLISKQFERVNVDVTLRPFVLNMIGWSLKIMLIISAASMIGVETTSFVAMLGAAGLAVGLALQGSLSNFAGGVLILILRPYKVGDLIKTQGEFGRVEEIQIFTTNIVTPDNKKAIIPNGAIANSEIINFSEKGLIRIDLVMGIAYDADIRKAKEVLLKVMAEHPLVVDDPAPFVGVLELADSSVNLAVRPHTHPDQYWDVYFDIYEKGKIALDDNKITIPFPQVDVHMKPE
ncbi:MAG: mechanosensitive ion channel [Flammeovirgaceae bacterium]|nr:mechanosensitive ion channel [Flammeovirgaceae bacterium]